MKKKLALLLASAMIMAVPGQVLAATGSIQGANYPVVNKTIALETGLVTSKSNTGSVFVDKDNITYIIDGQNLVVTLDKGYLAKANTMSFDVVLEGANWFFRQESAVTVPATKPGDNLNIVGTLSTASGGAVDSQKSAIAETNSFWAEMKAKGLSAAADPKGPYSTTYDDTKGFYKQETATYYRYQDTANTGLHSEIWNAASGAYLLDTDLDLNAYELKLPYRLDVQGGNEGSIARVTLLPMRNNSGDVVLDQYAGPNVKTHADKYTVTIPLVYRATGNEVKVSIPSGNGLGVYLAATPLGVTGTSRGTTTTIDSSATGRDRITLKDLRVAENVAGIITGDAGGIIQLKATTGFYFDNIDNIKLSLDWGLTWGTESSKNGTAGEGVIAKDSSDYKVAYKLNNYTTTLDRQTLYIYIPAKKIKPSSVPGALVIKGLELVADYNAPFEDVYVNISQVDAAGQLLTEDKSKYNLQESFGSKLDIGVSTTYEQVAIYESIYDAATGKYTTTNKISGYISIPSSTSTGKNPTTKLGISSQDVKVATRKNWTVTYKTLTDPIPELIAGRYSPALAASSAGNLDIDMSQKNAGDEHKASKVELSENALNAWWASRQTDFQLPEGVKFRKVEFDAWDNLSPAKTGTIIANGERTSYYTLDSSRLSLYSLTITANKLAKISFTPYISISTGYAGTEVPMTFSNTTSGTSVNNEGVQSVNIATVIKPITVEVSEVKELKIGYQTMAAGNVIIKETKAGMLQRGKELKVSVTDYITQDLYFAPIDAARNIEVASDGYFAIRDIKNLDVSNNTLTPAALIYGINSGTISMSIDRQSVTEPATITLKDLQVKVSRDVPQSTVNYDVVIWGDAVAANYGGERDQFAVPGISTQYVKVVSSANDQAVLTQEVRITIGEQYYLVEGKPVDLEAGAAAYVSADGATMVPLRFVSEAFGLSKDQILWDNTTKTATIIHPSRVLQFTAGSDRMLVNGSPVTMGVLGGDGNYYAYKAEIPVDRMFIPFRAIGEAFGVSVTWEDATKTAIYNAN